MSTPSDELSKHGLNRIEFISITAFLMALNALAIDIMLPAMSEIGGALGAEHDNDAQLIVIVYMVAFGISQLFWGPLTDAKGRRPVLLFVLLGYAAAGIGCSYAQDFESLLVWRAVLGIMAGGTRVVSVSIIRDLFSGRQMASVMSFVMTIFMVIPILAPSVGQGILLFSTWRGIFLFLAFGGVTMLVWSYFRVPETRSKDKRTGLDPKAVFSAYLFVLKTPIAIGYMIATGLIFGALFAFISAAEQIFNDVFHAEALFPIIFAVVAAAMSASNMVNGRLVERLGQRLLSHSAVIVFIVFSALLLVLTSMFGPNLIIFSVLFAVIFACFGFIGPNFNSMALEPLGAISGTASALLGFASTTMAALIGWAIAAQYDGTLQPLLLGFAVLGLLTLLTIYITEGRQLFKS